MQDAQYVALRESVNSMLKEWSREDLWVALCSRLQDSDQFSKFPYFASFLSQADIQYFQDSQITLAVRNELVRSFIQENLLSVIVDEFAILLKKPVQVNLEVNKTFVSKIPEVSKTSEIAINFSSDQVQSTSTPSIEAVAPTASRLKLYDPSEDLELTDEARYAQSKLLKLRIQEAGINAKLNFNHFVQGISNQNVYSASLNVADHPGQSMANPLVIYGSTGLGKTHLLHAIGNYSLENERIERASYITSEELLNHFVASVQAGNANPLMKYADLDLLLIDDIQFIARGKETQVHLMELIQILVQRGKQIVITCDQVPSDVRCAKNSKLHDGLLKGFEQGISIDVDRPDQATRFEILKQKAEQAAGREDYFPQEVLEFISQRYTSNVRELEGIILKLFAYKNIMKREISLDVARVILGDVRRNLHRKISIETILNAVAAEFKVTPALMTSQTRKQEVALPRKVAMYLCRALTDNSLHTIGIQFNRDYSTVQYCVRALLKLMVRSPELNAQIEKLKSVLRQES